ncbi:hypothetical protein CLJU_c01590 [Clostridium ljungdahlii DSM 13528]|uniref:Uncharacterized protein n=1 Tax=Clostridium ljungdahlii (strain ATCC 55383 / DSM 13528 / PETC) TaxID=748727 RepID=D8GKR6_CLOLD|nr:hypothetical protein CLJU_c01590 [Clostridium ljungdahlii DSM 13528]
MEKSTTSSIYHIIRYAVPMAIIRRYFFNIAVIRYLYYILNFILDRKLEEKDNLYYLKITCYPQNM